MTNKIYCLSYSVFTFPARNNDALSAPAQGNRGQSLLIGKAHGLTSQLQTLMDNQHPTHSHPFLGLGQSPARRAQAGDALLLPGGKQHLKDILQRAVDEFWRKTKKKNPAARVAQGWLAFRKCLVVCSSCGASSTTNSLTEWQQLYWQANSIKATATNKVAGSARRITNMESCLCFPKCPRPSLSLCMRGKGMNELGSDDGN